MPFSISKVLIKNIPDLWRHKLEEIQTTFKKPDATANSCNQNLLTFSIFLFVVFFFPFVAFQLNVIIFRSVVLNIVHNFNIN